MQEQIKNNKDHEEAELSYHTSLFNYYEYLAICLFKKLINEPEAKLYFKFPIKGVKDLFESSILFEKGYASREEYPGIQWLFKKWEV